MDSPVRPRRRLECLFPRPDLATHRPPGAAAVKAERSEPGGFSLDGRENGGTLDRMEDIIRLTQEPDIARLLMICERWGYRDVPELIDRYLFEETCPAICLTCGHVLFRKAKMHSASLRPCEIHLSVFMFTHKEGKQAFRKTILEKGGENIWVFLILMK
jgi:hypothetical protein